MFNTVVPYAKFRLRRYSCLQWKNLICDQTVEEMITKALDLDNKQFFLMFLRVEVGESTWHKNIKEFSVWD